MFTLLRITRILKTSFGAPKSRRYRLRAITTWMNTGSPPWCPEEQVSSSLAASVFKRIATTHLQHGQVWPLHWASQHDNEWACYNGTQHSEPATRAIPTCMRCFGIQHPIRFYGERAWRAMLRIGGIQATHRQCAAGGKQRSQHLHCLCDSELGPNRKQSLVRQNIGHGANRLLLNIWICSGLNGESRLSMTAKQSLFSQPAIH